MDPWTEFSILHARCSSSHWRLFLTMLLWQYHCRLTKTYNVRLVTCQIQNLCIVELLNQSTNLVYTQQDYLSCTALVVTVKVWLHGEDNQSVRSDFSAICDYKVWESHAFLWWHLLYNALSIGLLALGEIYNAYGQVMHGIFYLIIALMVQTTQTGLLRHNSVPAYIMSKTIHQLLIKYHPD